MKEIYLPASTLSEEKQVSAIDKKLLDRWTIVLYFSVIAGIISVFSGLVLGVVSYLGFAGDEDSINQTGNLLIVAAFSLMMLGAHALDKLNEVKINKK